MIAASSIETKAFTMKKILLMAAFGCFTYLGTVAQGNSAYGHSHKKAKKHHVYNSTAAQRTTINTQHRTTIKAATSNDALSNQQQKNQIKQANATHKVEMKAEIKGKKEGKDKK